MILFVDSCDSQDAILGKSNVMQAGLRWKLELHLKLSIHYNTKLPISFSLNKVVVFLLKFHFLHARHTKVSTISTTAANSKERKHSDVFVWNRTVMEERARRSRAEVAYNLSFVRLQWRLLALYRILLSVRIRIHWGMGRFCLSFLASFCLILKVLWDDMMSLKWDERD